MHTKVLQLEDQAILDTMNSGQPKSEIIRDLNENLVGYRWTWGDNDLIIELYPDESDIVLVNSKTRIWFSLRKLEINHRCDWPDKHLMIEFDTRQGPSHIQGLYAAVVAALTS